MQDSGINQSGKSFNSEKSQSNKKIINKVFGPEKFEQEENETKAPRNLKLEYSQEDEELEKFRTRYGQINVWMSLKDNKF